MEKKPDSDLVKHTKEHEDLSEREKDIVRSVAKGLSNKEIADEHFISIHTVITHRRNISRKLAIHSSAGLTVYAILNKLVDIEELRR
jgi:DNA-binding NarL/FixJ family response regulator